MPPCEYGGSTERQFDRARSHDAYARTAAQVWRSPKDAISASREMTADMVQPAPDASSGIAFDSFAVALRSKAREDLDMLEQIGFPGISASPIESIPIHDALLRTALRGQ
jgi:hypothetical protein